MNIFQLNESEVIAFFFTLIRMSVLVAIVPFFGDRMIPAPVKVLFSLCLTIMIYPILISTGILSLVYVDSISQQLGSLVTVLILEVFFGLLLGFMSRLVFDAIQIAGDLVGTFMGFSMANAYDPHQETNSQVIGKLKTTLAMILFVTINGHHIILRTIVESYKIVGVGQVNVTGQFAEKLILFTSEILRFGLQIAAPMAFSLFAINIIYGVIAKAVPQLNVLVLSFSVSALVGIGVMLVSMPEFFSVTKNLFVTSADRVLVLMKMLSV